MKKDAPCGRANRPDVAKTRHGWRHGQGSLDPARLVFIDESAAKTNMTRLRGRSPKGERLVCHAPHGHWRTTTMISSVRLDGTTACMTIEGATNSEVFYAYVREVLAPSLRRSYIVILDNLGAHKNERTLTLPLTVLALAGSSAAYAITPGSSATLTLALTASVSTLGMKNLRILRANLTAPNPLYWENER